MSVKERFKTLVFAVSLLTIALVSNFHPLLFEAEAGADEKVKIINYIKYYDVGGAYCTTKRVTSYETVVYDGYGHYYNYHIMGQSGHPNGHGWITVGTYVIHTTIQLSSCNT